MASDSSPGAERARKASERFRSSMDGIRSRTDATAKVFGGIAAAAVGGLGYSRLVDFFPYRGPWEGLAAAVVGVLVMALAAGTLVRRFRRASYAVVTSSNLSETLLESELAKTDAPSWKRRFPRLSGWKEKEGDREQERKLVEEAYAAVACMNGAASLAELEREGRKAECEAEREQGDAARKRQAYADRVLAEVQMAQDRAAAFLLRRRATQALFSYRSVALMILFIAGWYATAAGTDAIESKRTDEVELVKTCAEVRKAVGFADVELPSACGDLGTDLGSDQYLEATKAAVADVRQACLQDAQGDAAAAATCARIALISEEGTAGTAP